MFFQVELKYCHFLVITITSRDRHKSAPYLRLKNSRTSKWQVLFCITSMCQVFFYSTKVGPNWHVWARKRWDFFGFINIHSIVVKYQKHCRADPLGKRKFEKKFSQCQKNERGTVWVFSTSMLLQNIKNLKGDPLAEKNSKRSLTMPNKLKGEPFSLSRYCMLRGKIKNFLVLFARPNDSICDHKIL